MLTGENRDPIKRDKTICFWKCQTDLHEKPSMSLFKGFVITEGLVSLGCETP